MTYRPSSSGFVPMKSGQRRARRVLSKNKRETLTRTQRRHMAHNEQSKKRYQERGGKVHLTMATRKKVNANRAAKGLPPRF